VIAVDKTVSDIRELFVDLRKRDQYVIDKTGCRMLEIVAATFVADEPSVLGKVNEDYVRRELEWYRSQSLSVHDIPGGPPKIWEACADKDGMIHSNYGYLVWSDENHNQYGNVLEELRRNPDSRRAEMIYTRPSIWKEYNRNGMGDFICTDSVQYFIRDGELHADVRMRSNDAWAGFRNDRNHQLHVQEMLAADLGIPIGKLIWHAGSFHFYERNFYLIDHFMRTGETHITKREFSELYGEET